MSIPPNTPPPGGVYYTQPPPPPQSSSSGCWKAVGITCGVLVLLGIIFALVVGTFTYRAVRNAAQHPGSGGLFGKVFNVGIASANGIRIQQAIVKYHQSHGKYPKALNDLVADGLIDGKILHSGLDPNTDPGHISWKYTKPAEGAPGDTPILSLHYQITIPAGHGSHQTQDSDIVIHLDGTTSTVQQHDFRSEPSSGSGSSQTQVIQRYHMDLHL